MHNIDHTIILSVVISFLSYCFGIVTPQIEMLLWCIALDIFVGVLASFVNPRLMFNSRKMFKGITKKLYCFLGCVCSSSRYHDEYRNDRLNYLLFLYYQ